MKTPLSQSPVIRSMAFVAMSAALTLFPAAMLPAVHAANTWQAEPSLNTARNQFAGGVIDGKLYVFGGSSDTDNLKSIEMYDPAVGSWVYKADNEHNEGMGVEEVCGAAMNGKIYLVSAFTGNTFADIQISSSLDIYDPAANTWQSGPPLPTPAFGLSLTAHNKLYVIGGDDESNGIGNELITDKVWSLVIAEPSPSLTPVTVIPAAAGTPPSFTGTVTGGYPLGTAWLQASVDLGVADPWANIASMALDNLGSATFTNIPDPRPQAATAQRDFFRVSTTADRYTPPPPDGFALIPAGSFQMGQDGIATPVHSVYVSAFYMGKYEVTKELWDTVRAWGLNNGYTDLPVGNGSYASKGANHPVHSITWYAMVKWCNARSQKENLTPCYTVSGVTYKTGSSAPDCNWNANGYRMPSEAEWEKAARGGVSGKLFPWGTDTITHSQANYYSSTSYDYDVSPTRGYHPTYAVNRNPYSSPVGSYSSERVWFV